MTSAKPVAPDKLPTRGRVEIFFPYLPLRLHLPLR